MELLVSAIHVVVCLFLVLVVLVQGGNQGGVGAAFGGGNSQGVFGSSGATSFLGKLTYAAAMIFVVTSISLAIMQGTTGDVGLTKKLKSIKQEKTEQVEGGRESESNEKADNSELKPAESEHKDLDNESGVVGPK